MRCLSRFVAPTAALLFLSVGFAQTPQDAPSTGGWRKMSDQPAPRPATPAADVPDEQRAPEQGPPPGASYGTIPPALTIKAGTFITVRINQTLSSDRNQPGDAFTATLTQPVVVDGVVVAQRGQTVGGRVVESDRGGRVKGTARLGIQLTDLTLVDGTQASIESQLTSRQARDNHGDDAGTMITTTGVGAAIGAIADGGRGAGIGAGAGAAAGLAGVLLTRGRPAVVYPETVLTFRIQQPVTVSTERASQAFRFVSPDDYNREADLRARAPQRDDCGDRGCGPRYYYGGYYPYYYPYYYSYPYWGPGISFYYWGGGWGHHHHWRR